MDSITSSPKSKRPSFAKGTLGRSPSYIDDHLEYRSHQTGPPTSIDGIIESPSLNPTVVTSNVSLASRKSISAISPPPARKEFESVHTLSHTNCIQDVADAPRIVATVFYNAAQPRHPHPHADHHPSLNPLRPTDPLPAPSIAEGLAPTTAISTLR